MPPTRHNASGPDPSYGIHTPLCVPSGSLIGGSPFKLTCTAIELCPKVGGVDFCRKREKCILIVVTLESVEVDRRGSART